MGVGLGLRLIGSIISNRYLLNLSYFHILIIVGTTAPIIYLVDLGTASF